MLYKGRNTVKSFHIAGTEVIVKQFKTLSAARAILYLPRSSKARRAYLYGLEFLKRNIITPEPVAVVEIYAGPLLKYSYFLSTPLNAPDLTFMRAKDFNDEDVYDLARYIYNVQQKGVLHGDLNLSNILLADKSATDVMKKYALIDNNRSIILKPGKTPDIRQRIACIMRVTHRRDLLRKFTDDFFMIMNLDKPVRDKCRKEVFRLLLRREARKRFFHSLRH